MMTTRATRSLSSSSAAPAAMAATQSSRKMPLPSMRIIDDPLICAGTDGTRIDKTP